MSNRITVPKGLSSAAKEVMRCLFLHGPTLDGDIPSKVGRGDLVDLGLAERYNGYQWLTRSGIEVAIDDFNLGIEKERWDRKRRSA